MSLCQPGRYQGRQQETSVRMEDPKIEDCVVGTGSADGEGECVNLAFELWIDHTITSHRKAIHVNAVWCVIRVIKVISVLDCRAVCVRQGP